MSGKMQESGLTKIIPFIYISAILGPGTCVFSYPEFLGAHCKEWLQPSGCQITQVFFFFLAAPEGWDH